YGILDGAVLLVFREVRQRKLVLRVIVPTAVRVGLRVRERGQGVLLHRGRYLDALCIGAHRATSGQRGQDQLYSFHAVASGSAGTRRVGTRVFLMGKYSQQN